MSAILKQNAVDIANGLTKYGLWKGGVSKADLDAAKREVLASAEDYTEFITGYDASKGTIQPQIDTLHSNLRNIIKSFDYSGTTNINGAMLIDNIPSDFVCFITATHNYGAYFGVIPSVQYGEFKSLIFRDSLDAPLSNVSVSGKIYYVSNNS